MKQFIRNRWWELRTGAGNYLTMAVTFINLVFLISLKFSITGEDFYLLTLGVFLGVSSLSVLFGNLHRRWQQDTDARIANRAIIEDIANLVVIKLKESSQ